MNDLSPGRSEDERLVALERLRILDTPSSPGFDRVVALARDLLDVPVVLLTMVDRDRAWFKAKWGMAGDSAPRQIAFCGTTIQGDGLLVVDDLALDARFADNALVTDDPHFRFYAGAPLSLTPELKLGTLCVIDREPRTLSEAERRTLGQLAELACDQLRLHEINELLRQEIVARGRMQATLEDQGRELERQRDALQHLADHDPLTGLANRALLHQRLRRAMADAAQGAVGLLVIDLDDFKRNNDLYGHAAGDALLRAVARRLEGCTRPGDTVARLGGDEFVLLAPGVAGREDLAALGERVVATLSRPVAAGELMLPCTASVGLALYPDDEMADDRLLACADAAMYRAKAEGKARAVAFGGQM